MSVRRAMPVPYGRAVTAPWEERRLLPFDAGPGQLHGRGLDALDSPEAELRPFAVDRRILHVDDDRLADPELLPQDALGERVLDQLLDGPAQRPCPQLRVVPLLGQERARRRR